MFVTGASSGIGKGTAKHFQAQGWNVVAIMRTPAKETELGELDRVLVTRLDVTDSASIGAAVAEGVAKFVTDGTKTLRYTAGADAEEFMATRKALDDEAFIGGVKARLGMA